MKFKWLYLLIGFLSLHQVCLRILDNLVTVTSKSLWRYGCIYIAAKVFLTCFYCFLDTIDFYVRTSHLQERKRQTVPCLSFVPVCSWVNWSIFACLILLYLGYRHTLCIYEWNEGQPMYWSWSWRLLLQDLVNQLYQHSLWTLVVKT